MCFLWIYGCYRLQDFQLRFINPTVAQQRMQLTRNCLRNSDPMECLHKELEAFSLQRQISSNFDNGFFVHMSLFSRNHRQQTPFRIFFSSDHLEQCHKQLSLNWHPAREINLLTFKRTSDVTSVEFQVKCGSHCTVCDSTLYVCVSFVLLLPNTKPNS